MAVIANLKTGRHKGLNKMGDIVVRRGGKPLKDEDRLADPLANALVYALGAGLSTLFGVGGHAAVREIGRKIVWWLEEKEGIRFEGDDPASLLDNVYQTLKDLGYVEDFEVKMEGDVATVKAWGCVNIKAISELDREDIRVFGGIRDIIFLTLLGDRFGKGIEPISFEYDEERDMAVRKSRIYDMLEKGQGK